MIDYTSTDSSSERLAAGYGGRFYGVYAAVVTRIFELDGQQQGRVKVRLPWSPDANGDEYEVWARLATMMAGNNRGSWFIPDPGDEVLVAFEAGDTRRPYVVGMLWNGVDHPPEQMDPQEWNYLKTIRSRNGVRITMNDQDGQESLTLVTPAQQTIVLRDDPPSIEAQNAMETSFA